MLKITFGVLQSVRVPVKNLSALCGPSKQIDVASLQESLGWAFLRTDVDGHMVDDEALACQRGFQLVRPEEVWFPGKLIALFMFCFLFWAQGSWGGLFLK